MNFFQIDGTAFIQLLNFAIFFAILNVVFMRPVARAIANRRAYINSLTNDYDSYQAEGVSLRTQAEAIRAAARREAEQAMAQSRAEASNETANIAADYGQRASQTVEEAQRTVESELEAARTGQDRSVSELADAILSRALPELAR